MKHFFLGAGAAVLLAACSGEPADRREVGNGEIEVSEPTGPPVPRQDPHEAVTAAEAEIAWESVASGEGTALRLVAPDGTLQMSIACLADPARLEMNVPAFDPVMSEDRFALGLGEEPVTLVANPYEQGARPGVTGEGPVPENFAALVDAAADIRALYGAQQAGPFPAPSPALKTLLVQGCGGGNA